MNFHKGILESRRLHYRHLAKLLVGILSARCVMEGPVAHDLPATNTLEYPNGD